MWIFTFPSKNEENGNSWEGDGAAVRLFAGDFESPAIGSATDLDLIIIVLRIAATTSSIAGRPIRWRRMRMKLTTRTSHSSRTAAQSGQRLPRRSRRHAGNTPLHHASLSENAHWRILIFSLPYWFEFQPPIKILIFFLHPFFL